MGSVNTSNPNTDQSVKIFDRFYLYEDYVPVPEYDAIYSYFRSVFTDATAAGNFTVTVFRIAKTSGIPAMTLLQQLQGQDASTLTLTLAYYLNGIRSSSTLLGVNVPSQPNYYVARNIRA